VRSLVRLTGLPVAVAYGLPLLLTIVSLAFGPMSNTAYIAEAVWLLPLAVGLATIILRKRVHVLHVRRGARILLAVLAVAFLLVCCVKLVVQQRTQVHADLFSVSTAMELKPAFHLLVAIVWLTAFRFDLRSSLVAWGYVLAGAVLIQVIVSSAVAHGFVRPALTGEPNYDAFLLALSLVALLGGSRRVSRAGLVLILIALLSTASRTFVFVGAVYTWYVYRRSIRGYLLIIILGVGTAVAGVVRHVTWDIAGMDRVGMWSAAYDTFSTSGSAIAVGFPIGAALPTDIPAKLAYLWDMQASAWGLSGVYPYNFHSMWLRLALSWGIPVALCLLLLVLRAMLFGGKDSFPFGVGLLFLVGGATMGVVYLTSPGVVGSMALMYALTGAIGCQIRFRQQGLGEGHEHGWSRLLRAWHVPHRRGASTEGPP
jgi:hypothetical protein